MSTQTHSEPVPGRPKLPQELLDMIIDESRDDNASLQQLSLVCTSFYQQARCHLFRRIKVICRPPNELYCGIIEVPSPCNLSRWATIDQFIEFIRLCESPHSTWSPRVVKELDIEWPLDDSLLTLLAASHYPEELLRRTTAKLDVPRARDVFRGLDTLHLSDADTGNWHRIGVLPRELFSMAFPSIRHLTLLYPRFSAIEDLWNILTSVPLLEEFELMDGTFDTWSTTLENVCLTRQLPHLRSFTYRCSNVSRLRHFMPVFSRLPVSHLRRYEFFVADRDDFPAISTLMTMAGSDGPAKQQWSFGFLPSSYEQPGVQDSEGFDFIAGHLCLTQNTRISEIGFGYEYNMYAHAWPLVPKLLQRFVKRSSSKSNLEVIVLPPLFVDKWSPGSDIFSIMERIDEILDDDVFSGLQELHLYPIRGPVDVTQPPDEKTKIWWETFKPILNDIQERYLSRALKRGICWLHIRNEWFC